MRRAISAILLLLAPLPAVAQQAKEPTTYDRAIAAGYKALTLCSALFNAASLGARREQESVEANELKGIYPEYDALIGEMKATVEWGDIIIAYHDVSSWGRPIATAAAVTVAYSDGLPPRIAVPRGPGCTILPIGSDPGQRAPVFDWSLPSGKPPAGGVNWDWPLWDVSATARPRGDASALAASVARAFSPTGYGEGTNTIATLVVQDGKIVSERYAPGFAYDVPTRTWSVAKSISGTLVGVAAAEGLLDPKAPAPVPEWQEPGDPRAAITLDNLLRMASGLHGDTAGNRTDAIYFGGTAVTEETVAWPIEAPAGTRFRYANNDILLAIRALRSKLAPDRADNFPNALLFGPLQMRATFAERDWQGNYILSSQVWSTARDLARLGMFWLADGVVDGRRLLPEGWMTYMTTASGPQPASGPGYGATLWLFGRAQGLPEGSYAAQGNRGQYVMVIPSKKLVIVRRGEDPGQARFDIAKFTADVIKALP